MKIEKDFKEIGKNVPCQVPPGFFDTITEKTLKNAKLRSRKRNIKHLLIWTSAAASIIVVLAFSGLIMNRDQKIKNTETRAQSIEKPPYINSGKTQDSVYAFGIKPAENERNIVSEYKSEYQEETFENLLASLTEEELQILAGQISAEIYFNELIDE